MKIENTGTFILALVVLALLQNCADRSSSVDEPVADTASVQIPTQSILEIMLEEITPATNTLWGADNPTTDEDWMLLETAALKTIAAARKTGIGGTGPMDSEWVANEVYQAMNNTMLSAAEASLAAIQARDIDALFVAGDQLYAPCEACHLQFNPGVVNQ